MAQRYRVDIMTFQIKIYQDGVKEYGIEMFDMYINLIVYIYIYMMPTWKLKINTLNRRRWK